VVVGCYWHAAVAATAVCDIPSHGRDFHVYRIFSLVGRMVERKLAGQLDGQSWIRCFRWTFQTFRYSKVCGDKLSLHLPVDGGSMILYDGKHRGGSKGDRGLGPQ